MAYNYCMTEYCKSADHANADALSRLPRSDKDTTAEEKQIFQNPETGAAPVELFLKCQLRTRFTRLKTSLERAVEEKQNTHHDKMAVKLWHLLLGDRMCIRNFHGKKES